METQLLSYRRQTGSVGGKHDAVPTACCSMQSVLHSLCGGSALTFSSSSPYIRSILYSQHSCAHCSHGMHIGRVNSAARAIPADMQSLQALIMAAERDCSRVRVKLWRNSRSALLPRASFGCGVQIEIKNSKLLRTAVISPYLTGYHLTNSLSAVFMGVEDWLSAGNLALQTQL